MQYHRVATDPSKSNETQLQNKILKLARMTGWLSYHTWDSRKSQPGFPDLVLVRRERLVFAELKSEKGKLTPAQVEWNEALKATAAEVYVWRPADWVDSTIERCLL